MKEKTGTLSKMAEVCTKCARKDMCDRKRMEMCAFTVPGPHTAEFRQECVMPAAAPISSRPDKYFDVVVNGRVHHSVNVTDIARQIEKRMRPLDSATFVGT